MSQPIALTTTAVKTDLAKPEDIGGAEGKPIKGRPKMEKAQLTLYDPSPSPTGGGERCRARHGALPVQPQGSHHHQGCQMGTQDDKRIQEGWATGVHWRGALEDDLGDVLRRHQHPGRFGCQGCRNPARLLRAHREERRPKKPSPPLVVLHWGTLSSFPAFVTSVSVKFNLFTSGGTPIRAVCSVSMEEMPGEKFRQNPTSGSQEVRRVHRIVAGDSLASLAYAEYGDPNVWRALAAFNQLDDPLRIRTGTVLLLPSPDELAAAGSGIPALAAAR